MASLGFRSINEMVGQVESLHVDGAVDHWKAQGINLEKLLAPAVGYYEDTEVYCTIDQDHALEDVLDRTLVKKADAALTNKEKVTIDSKVVNTDRSVGTILSHYVSKAHGEEGLPEDTIEINLTGSAGQSIGAFLAPGVTIRVEGDANDYCGKGLSGGKLAIFPPKAATFESNENILIGNVALYGATAGEAYFSGVAAERFAVRNSGAHAVIEGIGDHGCEYMTGGRVAVLGKIGRNFAAGMSGGVAYLYDPDDNIEPDINMEMIDIEVMEKAEDISELRNMITRHVEYTGSKVGAAILENWGEEFPRFRKIIPIKYREVLRQRAEAAAKA